VLLGTKEFLEGVDEKFGVLGAIGVATGAVDVLFAVFTVFEKAEEATVGCADVDGDGFDCVELDCTGGVYGLKVDATEGAGTTGLGAVKEAGVDGADVGAAGVVADETDGDETEGDDEGIGALSIFGFIIRSIADGACAENFGVEARG
jgi:hypothetical protein